MWSINQINLFTISIIVYLLNWSVTWSVTWTAMWSNTWAFGQWSKTSGKTSSYGIPVPSRHSVQIARNIACNPFSVLWTRTLRQHAPSILDISFRHTSTKLWKATPINQFQLRSLECVVLHAICTQQFQRWTHGKIGILLRALFHRVSRRPFIDNSAIIMLYLLH